MLKATEAEELKASQRMQDALKRAGGSLKQLDSLINELQQSSKQPSL